MAANPEWHYAKNNQQFGPVSSAELKQLAASGELSPNNLIWKEGMTEWKVAGTVKGLFPQAPASPMPPPLPQNPASQPTTVPPSTSNVADTVKSDLNDFVNTGKRAKDYAVAQTRRTQLTQITLPKAYLALGKDVFVGERFREEFGELVQRIIAKNDEIAKVKASTNERPQATDLKGKIQSGAAQLMAQGHTTKLNFQRESLVRELGKKAFESHGPSAGSHELVSPITSALEEIEKLDTIIKPASHSKGTPLWQRIPLAALLTVCCFPVGLFLVWYNPRLTRQSKAIWIGGFATIFIGMMIFAQQSAQRAQGELSAANQLWASGDNQAAISKYRGLTTRLPFISESDRSLVLGRVIDFDAESGNIVSVNELLAIADKEHVVPTISSEKARSLLAKRLNEQQNLTGSSNKRTDSSQKVSPAAEPSKSDIPSIAKGRLSSTKLIAHLKRVEKLEIHGPENGSPTKGSPFESFGKMIDEPCRLHVGGRVDFGQNVSVILFQSEKDGRVPIIVVGTPFDHKSPITRGNDLTSIDSFLRTLLPELNIRKIVGDQWLQLIGEGAKAEYGKAHIVVSYDGKTEIRVTIYIDDDAPHETGRSTAKSDSNQLKPPDDVWRGGTKAEFISRVHAFNLKDYPKLTLQCYPNQGIVTTYAESKSHFYSRFGHPASESTDFDNAPTGASQSLVDKFQIWSYSCKDGVLRLKVQPSRDGKLLITAAKK